jgi:hypothetical protein
MEAGNGMVPPQWPRAGNGRGFEGATLDRDPFREPLKDA